MTRLAALLILTLLASGAAPPPGRSCAELRLSYRLRDLLESDPAASPCGPLATLSFGACDPREVWTSLRALYIRNLASVDGDEVGREASAFLAASSVTLRGAAPAAGGDSRNSILLAVYRHRENRITLSNALITGLWPRLEGSNLPPEAEAAVDATAASIVHELRHARQAHELGYIDRIFFETESLAYADEALFLWARLARDPDYQGMGTFNSVLLSTAGFPAPPAQWWKEPLDAADLPRLKAHKDIAKELMGPALRNSTVNEWFAARSLGAGFAGMEEMLRWLGVDRELRAFETPEGYLTERAAAGRTTLKKLRGCRDLEPLARDRDNFQAVIDDLEGDLRFYSDKERQLRQLRYYREERARQEERRARLL